MPLGQGNLINYGNPIDTVSDARLTTSVQTALQNRTDVNSLKIEEMINKVSNTPLVRDKDKEYIGNRLNSLIQSTNNALKVGEGSGLMSNTLTSEINRYISSAIDDNVLKQIDNSKKIINFENGLVDLKNKKPELYSDDNYAYAKYKSGYNSYMSGASDDLGSLEYHPYVDYKQTTMEKALKLKQLKGDQEIEVPDGRGNLVKTKISGLTPQEIIQYFPSMLTPQEEQQMVIDGWTALRGANPEQIAQQATNFFSSKRNSIENKIKELDALEESGTQSEKMEARRLKSVYNNDLEDLIAKENRIDKTNPEQVGYLLNREDFLNTASNLFSGRTSITYSKDDTFFTKLKLEQDLEAKAEKEAKTKQQELVDNQIYVSPIKNQEVEPADFYKDVRQNFNNAYNTVVSTSEQAYNDLNTPDTIKTRYETTLKKNNYEIRNGKIVSTIPNNKVSKAAVAELAFNESGMNNLPFGYDKKISEAGTVRSFLSNALIESEKSFGKDFNTEDFYKEFLEAKQVLGDFNIARTFDFSEISGGFGAIVAPITDMFRENEQGNNPETQKRLDVQSKMQDFINRQGGEKVLLERMKGSPSTVKDMISLLKEAAEADPAIYDTWDKADSNLNKVGEKLKNLGVDPFVKSKWTATIGGESLMNDIVKSIPAQDMQGSALFNPKEGNITVRKLNENEIEITQAQGIKLDKDKNSIGIAPARTVVVRGSDTFNLISQNIDVENKFTLDAQNTPSGFKIKPNIKPQFYNLDSELDFVQNLRGRYEANVSGKVKQEIQSRIGGYNIADYFSSDEGARQFLNGYLGDSVSSEQIDNLINRISKDFDKYNIEYINNNKNNWMVRFSTPSGVEVMGNLSNSSELDGDYTYILKNMPQLLIMTEIAKYLKNNPQKIDSL